MDHARFIRFVRVIAAGFGLAGLWYTWQSFVTYHSFYMGGLVLHIARLLLVTVLALYFFFASYRLFWRPGPSSAIHFAIGLSLLVFDPLVYCAFECLSETLVGGIGVAVLSTAIYRTIGSAFTAVP